MGRSEDALVGVYRRDPVRLRGGFWHGFSWDLDLWVELTGGISGKNGWKVDVVGFQQAVERLVVELLPDRVTIGRENQCVTHLIEVDSPILTVGVLWVLERAEILGVAAMRLPILGLDG